jgi:hypothetical protein
MIISGTITNASVASEPQGVYGVRYQDVVIQAQDGTEHVGRIGSKQGYAVGTQVQVTAEQKQSTQGPYLYFKKYNPQYAQQGATMTTPQPTGLPPQQPAAQQKQGPDWDKIAEGKVLCNVVCAAIQSNQMPCPDTETAQQWTDIIMGKRKSLGAPVSGASPAMSGSDELPEDLPF